VIGVSADTQDTNDKFAKSLALPYPLVGDASGEILRAYKARWPVIGLARRVTYVIGRERRIELAFESQFDAEAHVAQTCALVAGR
jgi:peroxiredoxin